MSSYESYSLKTSIFIFSIFFGFLHFFVCVWLEQVSMVN